MASRKRAHSRKTTYTQDVMIDPCEFCGRTLYRADPFVVDGNGRLKCIWCHDKNNRIPINGKENEA
jgi:hypothetical protein